MKIRIETKTVQGNDLQPGDLFSFASEEHWLTVNDERDPNPVGEKVYIRTNAPALTPKEDANVTLVTFRYVNDEGKSPPWVGTKLHHESFHVDMDIDDDGHKVAAMFPNSNCPYCKGELTVTEPWDGKGAHLFEPPVPVELIEEGHPCIHCGESDKLGNHQLEPKSEDCFGCGKNRWSNPFEARGRQVIECGGCGAQQEAPSAASN